MTWTLVNPNQAVTKAFAPATADAGDTVTVNLGWTNSNSANSPMFQCVITDNLNAFATIFDLASVAAGITPANYTYSYAGGIVSYTYTTAGGSGRCRNATWRISVRLVHRQAARDGTYGRLDHKHRGHFGEYAAAEPVGRRDAHGDGQRHAEPDARRRPTPRSSRPRPRPAAAGANIAIGEIVTYRVTFNIPDGVTSAVTLVDEMQGGLANFGYVADSARLSRNS